VEDRLPLLNGGAVLVLILVAALTALLVVLVWVSLDPGHDDAPVYVRPVVELSRP
jgi:hypothetical protein